MTSACIKHDRYGEESVELLHALEPGVAQKLLCRRPICRIQAQAPPDNTRDNLSGLRPACVRRSLHNNRPGKSTAAPGRP